MISDQDMEHLKDLARLELSDQETQAFKADINKTLEYFEALKALNTDGVEEMARPIELFNVFREDNFEPTLSHEEAMKVAVEAKDGFFKVPRTVDAGE